MMAQRYFDLRDPVNQAATVGHHGQVSPPATPHLRCHRFEQFAYSARDTNTLATQFEKSGSKGTGEF